jgi:hypothetical protein
MAKEFLRVCGNCLNNVHKKEEWDNKLKLCTTCTKIAPTAVCAQCQKVRLVDDIFYLCSSCWAKREKKNANRNKTNQQ